MSSPSSLTVLVISDCEQTRAALGWMLRVAFSDPAVIEAAGSASATDALAAQRIDCVLLDAGAACAHSVLQSLTPQTHPDGVPLLLVASGADARQRQLGESFGVTQWLFRESLAPPLLEQAVRSAIEVSSLQLMLTEQGRELDRLHKVEQAAAEAEAAASAAAEARAAEQARQDSEHAVAATATAASELSAAEPTEPPPAETQGDAGPQAAPSPLSLYGHVQAIEDEELASRVQRDLQPPGSPLLEGYEVAGLSIPAEATGGDYYDYLPLGQDSLTVSIGECSGRGLAPVILMSSLRAYLRVLASRSQDVSEIVSEVNSLITDDIGDEEFLVTLLLVQIDVATKTLQYCSAGLQAHLIDRNGRVTELPSTGMPLGLRRETVIPPGEPQKLHTGDLLLLTTDGAQKVASPSGELFGRQSVLDVVSQNRDLPPRMIVNFLKKACREFAGGTAPSDDITVVIVKASGY